MLLLLRVAFVIAVLGVWLYCVFDVIRSEAESIRYLHKLVWLAFVLLVPTIGSLAWLLLGRPRPIGPRLAAPAGPPQRAPDDSPEFLSRLSDEIRRRRRAEQLRSSADPTEIDEEIRRLEDELRRRAEQDRDEDGKA